MWKLNRPERTGCRYDKYPDIPIYFTTGWYDFFERGSLNNFHAMATRHKSPTKFFIGPWEHSSVGPRFTGDVDFGALAEFDMFAEQLRWFDETLKGQADGDPAGACGAGVSLWGAAAERRTMREECRMAGQWITAAAAWPPPGAAVASSYYLHGDGNAFWMPWQPKGDAVPACSNMIRRIRCHRLAGR